ncbi:MAG: sialate O-acetylesterase [Lachnospiraceae bacterium]|nr:sialate O-acetylesterase [Lachnospiraceae bacterium]
MSLLYSKTVYPENLLETRPVVFSLAKVFSNHCVLQRNKPLYFFGTCPENSEISVTIYSEGKALACGKRFFKGSEFILLLPALNATDNTTVKAVCKTGNEVFTQELTDVCFGEVFLAGGQSNMEFELQNCVGGKEELASVKESKVRFYYTQKNAFFDEHFFEAENWSGWQTFSQENAEAWSAVGYFFGKELAEKLDCTVGILGCNWGGTSATSWMNRETVDKSLDFKKYVEDYEEKIGNDSLEEQKRKYDEYLAYNAEWQKRIDAFYAKNPNALWEDALKECGDSIWPGPLNSFNPIRTGGLYESMLKRVAPYTVKGVIWYQGESDDHRPDMYHELFTAMINDWRKLFKDDTLPFIFTQLPMHRYIQDADWKHWCKIREAQMKTFNTVNHTGIAVCLDCGKYNDIHPTEKNTVAHRLLLQALKQVYDDTTLSDEECFAPTIKYSEIIDENTIKLNFNNMENGFKIEPSIPYGDPNPIDKINKAVFEVHYFTNDASEAYEKVEYVIDNNAILLKVSNAFDVDEVRYAWTNYGVVELFNKFNQPLAPFRIKI